MRNAKIDKILPGLCGKTCLLWGEKYRVVQAFAVEYKTRAGIFNEQYVVISDATRRYKIVDLSKICIVPQTKFKILIQKILDIFS